MMLAVASCGGRVEGSGGDGGGASFSSPNVPDASAADSPAWTVTTAADASEEPLGAGSCTSPMHVPAGGTLSGSTCGGGVVPEAAAWDYCGKDDPTTPAVYFVVDAPEGAGITVNRGTARSLYALSSCGNGYSDCTAVGNELCCFTSGSFWVFAAVSMEEPCGAFTISIPAD
jgi:hypothetical protein